jgi:DNA processing protein
VRGDASILNQPSLRIVGTRRPTLYGAQMAERIARDLATRGIDAIAHRGTVAVHGRAVGVLGTGIDLCYPKKIRNCTSKC